MTIRTDGPTWDDIDNLQRQIDELRQAVFPFERPVFPSPLIPKFESKGCFICGVDHGGLTCPKLISTSGA